MANKDGWTSPFGSPIAGRPRELSASSGSTSYGGTSVPSTASVDSASSGDYHPPSMGLPNSSSLTHRLTSSLRPWTAAKTQDQRRPSLKAEEGYVSTDEESNDGHTHRSRSRSPRRGGLAGSRKLWLTIVVVLTLIVMLLLRGRKAAARWVLASDEGRAHRSFSSSSSSSDGRARVLLTMKTGHAVLHTKMAMHKLSPPLQDAHLPFTLTELIYSDADTVLADGTIVYDALANATSAIQHQDDFQAYYDLQELLQEGQPPELASGGYSLDKYKFLGLVRHAFELHPDAAWMVNVEEDTYAFRAPILDHLATLDPDEQHYLGNLALSGDVEFAHGGSGYVLSRGLLRQLFGADLEAEDRSVHLRNLDARWSSLIEHSCCGDLTLAEVMYATPGVFITGPTGGQGLFQAEPPRSVYFDEEHWCRPILSVHHIKPSEVGLMQEFDRELARGHHHGRAPRYKDLFTHFTPAFIKRGFLNAQPTIGTDEELVTLVKEEWDNLSHNRIFGPDWAEYFKVPYDEDLCSRLCEEDERCLSWSFGASEERAGDSAAPWGQGGWSAQEDGTRGTDLKLGSDVKEQAQAPSLDVTFTNDQGHANVVVSAQRLPNVLLPPGAQQCRTADYVRFGKRRTGIRSAWRLDRIRKNLVQRSCPTL